MLYELTAKYLYTQEDIAQVESRVAIFTWLNVYDPDSNIAKEKIAVNSIIATCFWVATGLPAFIAFIMLCTGLDIGQEKKVEKEEQGKEKDQNWQQNQEGQNTNQGEQHP